MFAPLLCRLPGSRRDPKSAWQRLDKANQAAAAKDGKTTDQDQVAANRLDKVNRIGGFLTQPIEALVDQLDLPKDQGLVLHGISPDSAAAKAGLRNNDILLESAARRCRTSRRNSSRF